MDDNNFVLFEGVREWLSRLGGTTVALLYYFMMDFDDGMYFSI